MKYGVFVYNIWFLGDTLDEVRQQIDTYESTLNRRLLSYIIKEL